MKGSEPITILLRQWRSGDTAALDKLSPLVYQELRRIADQYMRGERKSHTLQPTALVNEAFVKLLGNDTGYSNRKHFYAIAARQMRHILVDYARTRERKKRGAEYSKITFDENQIADRSQANILEIDDALNELHRLDKRKHNILELYYFGGLRIRDIAECFDLSTKTVQREIRMAEAWLYTVLNPHEDDTHTMAATGLDIPDYRRP